jgi:FkbM family methyltransferase
MSKVNSPLEASLDKLLNKDASWISEYENKAFDRLTAPFQNSLVLFGAGNFGRQVLSALRTDGIEPLAFSDNNPAVWGNFINGVKVYSPIDAAKYFGQKATFVVTIWNKDHSFIQTWQQLSALKCIKVVSALTLRWKYPETLLPFLWLDLPSNTYKEAGIIKTAFALWDDEFSRREYLAQLNLRLLGEFDSISSPVEQESYFPDDIFDLNPDENFVDCGAFDGITIHKFLEHRPDFRGRIIAFEPDPQNYEKLAAYVSHLDPVLTGKVLIFPYAVGSKDTMVQFNASGTMGSAVSKSGRLEVECVTLNKSMQAQQFIPSYIKMDIEGSELDALNGATHLISQHPILAICLYHRYNDLWRIPLFINSLSDQYRFFLRPHEIENWQLVCYAVPLNRLKTSE